jgi:hypothetical protein
VRRSVVAFVITFVVALSGVATATVFAGSPLPKAPAATDQDEKAREGTEQESGIHGGPIERFHQAGGCDLTAIGPLPGNWTHGDYVSAVAAGGDPTQIQAAAHSDCGKPMVAVGHGGPPAFAMQHAAAGKAHAATSPDDAGEGPPGS